MTKCTVLACLSISILLLAGKILANEESPYATMELSRLPHQTGICDLIFTGTVVDGTILSWTMCCGGTSTHRTLPFAVYPARIRSMGFNLVSFPMSATWCAHSRTTGGRTRVRMTLTMKGCAATFQSPAAPLDTLCSTVTEPCCRPLRQFHSAISTIMAATTGRERAPWSRIWLTSHEYAMMSNRCAIPLRTSLGLAGRKVVFLRIFGINCGCTRAIVMISRTAFPRPRRSHQRHREDPHERNAQFRIVHSACSFLL